MKNDEKGNDILDILMFLDQKRWKRQWCSWYFNVFGWKTMKKAMIFLIFWCFWIKNDEKGNDVLDILMFLDEKRWKRQWYSWFSWFWDQYGQYPRPCPYWSQNQENQEYHCLFHCFWSKNIKKSRISLPFSLFFI